MTQRRGPPGRRGQFWTITVCSADNAELLFHGTTADRAELEAVAAEARRRRPHAKIWIRDPFDKVRAWD